MDNSDVKAGIGGWLLLTSVRIPYSLYKDLWPIFSEGHWETLTAPTSSAYHPYWAPLLIFETVGNVLLVVLTLVAAYFFFRKLRYAPRIMIAWLAFILAFIATDFFVADLVPAVAAQNDTESARELVRAAIGAAIWIPYFAMSKRVKATFVK